MAAENAAAQAGENAKPRNTGSVTGGRAENQDSRSGIASNLRSVGNETDRMTEAAGERVSELRRLLIEEVRAQPLRALAWAAAAGALFGFCAAR